MTILTAFLCGVIVIMVVLLALMWVRLDESRQEVARWRRRADSAWRGRDVALDLVLHWGRKAHHEMLGRKVMAERVEALNRGKVAAERSLVIALQALIERETLIADLSDEVGWGAQHLADAIDRLSGRRPIVDIELPTGEQDQT
jgi:hypothetical protein